MTGADSASCSRITEREQSLNVRFRNSAVPGYFANSTRSTSSRPRRSTSTYFQHHLRHSRPDQSCSSKGESEIDSIANMLRHASQPSVRTIHAHMDISIHPLTSNLALHCKTNAPTTAPDAKSLSDTDHSDRHPTRSVYLDSSHHIIRLYEYHLCNFVLIYQNSGPRPRPLPARTPQI